MKKGHKSLRKGRHSEAGLVYHVTFRIDKNRQRLSDRHRRIVSRFIESSELKDYWQLFAWVVMPDHVHLLFELKGQKTLSELASRIKSKTSLEINRGESVKTSLWQRGFYDHGFRSEDSIIEAARYIVANPIRANLVSGVGFYPYWNSVWL
jgi:putative transposase